LEDILLHDWIYPPATFQNFIKHIWKSWRNGAIDEDEAKEKLDELIVWLNEITKLRPQTKFWKNYFVLG
jgi:pyruvate-formate lyase